MMFVGEEVVVVLQQGKLLRSVTVAWSSGTAMIFLT